MRWEIRRARGNVSELQESSAAAITQLGGGPTDARRGSAVVQNGLNRALVLGSAQLDSTVDQEACAAAGVEVVRRRSGGGAVLVDPSSLVWVDLVVAATDALWSADVGRSMWWVGEAWAKALEGAGLRRPQRLERPDVAQRLVFAGLFCRSRAGRGHQQRTAQAGRHRSAADAVRCAVPVRLRSALGPRGAAPTAVPTRRPTPKSLARELAGAALGVGVERAEAVVDGFLAALPS